MVTEMSWQDRYSLTRIYLTKHSLTKRFINWRKLVREVTTITKCQGKISILHSLPTFLFLFHSSSYLFGLRISHWDRLGISWILDITWGEVIFGSLGESTISWVRIVCESLQSTSFSLGFSLVGVESFKSFWMLSSTTSLLCNEFLAGAKSLTETVDLQPLVNLVCIFWGVLRVILLHHLMVSTY